MDLIERLRAVKWEEADDCGWMPDDPTHKCVFVDMRPAEFQALLREAAAALEAARDEVDALAKDAAKYRWGINNARWIRSEQEAYVAIPVERDADLSCVAMRDTAIDAAIDQARGKGVADA